VYISQIVTISRICRQATAVALVATVVAACNSRKIPAAVQHADFIVTTADSSYWVTSGPQGLRMRGVPMLLARVDGRYREIYAADDDHSYYDAVLVGATLWSRDLVTGDSSRLFADTLVPRFAASYAKAHPSEVPLGKDDDTADHPSATVTADIDVLGVHGPYLSYEYRTDMDVAGERVNTDRHTARRGVLDLRTGKAVTVAALFGSATAERIARDASTEWKAARDSLLALHDRRSRRAQRTVAAFEFDSSSFTIASRDGRPRVVYAVPGVGARGSLSALELAPRDVPMAPWWVTVRDELPSGPDSLLTWRRGTVELRAALTPDGDVARLVLRDAARHDWRVGAVSAPVWRVLWLDASTKAADRKALSRAFNDASMYSTDAHIVMAPRRASARFLPASFIRQ